MIVINKRSGRTFGVVWLFVLLAVGCNTPQEQAGAPCSECEPSGATAAISQPIPENTFATRWLAPEQRADPVGGFVFETQNANKVSLADLSGAPLAISFVYTRCQNQRKCPLVARTMADLAMSLEKSTEPVRPKLALVTYDPEYDTPSRLGAFARLHGFNPSPDAILLRPDATARQSLFNVLKVSVNYDQNGVNLHGIQLILLDKQGRFVRAYQGMLWDNEQVLADLRRLARE